MFQGITYSGRALIAAVAPKYACNPAGSHGPPPKQDKAFGT